MFARPRDTAARRIEAEPSADTGALPTQADVTEGLGDQEIIWCQHGNRTFVACVVTTPQLAPDLFAILKEAADRVQAELTLRAAPPKAPPLTILP